MTQIQKIERILEKKSHSSFLKPFVKLPDQQFSSFSHLIGVILSIVMSVLIPIRARGDLLGVFLCLLYGLSNVFLFLSSTMTHSQRESEIGQGIWLKFDKIGIYFLIAGTYSVLSYFYLTGAWRLGIIIAQWIFASLGTILTLFEFRVPRWITAGIYLIQGWMIIFGINLMFSAMQRTDFTLMLIAGIVYSGGAIFYVTKKPKLWPGKFGPHDLWHVCVLIGAILFFITVMRIV